jgi:hypothetical protein
MVYYKLNWLFKKKDWKGFPVFKKGLILFLFSLDPLQAWKKYNNDLLKALEVTNVEICNNKELMNFMFNLKYSRCPKLLMTFREMINLYKALKKTEKLDGDIAEVGVYRGGSAAIFAHFKGERSLNLFDTFEGLPEVNRKKDILQKGQMKDTSEQMVRDLLKDYSNISIYKGIFPDTAVSVKDKKFSLINLDTDLYDSTYSSLDFFYPRMQKGGIIITHDYGDLLAPGVREAFDKFFADKHEPIIELWDTQAMIVKQ